MQWSIGKTRARNDEPQHMHTVQSLGGALGGRPQMPWQNMHHAVEPPTRTNQAALWVRSGVVPLMLSTAVPTLYLAAEGL